MVKKVSEVSNNFLLNITLCTAVAEAYSDVLGQPKNRDGIRHCRLRFVAYPMCYHNAKCYHYCKNLKRIKSRWYCVKKQSRDT